MHCYNATTPDITRFSQKISFLVCRKLYIVPKMVQIDVVVRAYLSMFYYVPLLHQPLMSKLSHSLQDTTNLPFPVSAFHLLLERQISLLSPGGQWRH
jgi:hypothetical protein